MVSRPTDLADVTDAVAVVLGERGVDGRSGWYLRRPTATRPEEVTSMIEATWVLPLSVTVRRSM
jgi:hypothetical protein